jgi:hypothetical protein
MMNLANPGFPEAGSSRSLHEDCTRPLQGEGIEGAVCLESSRGKTGADAKWRTAMDHLIRPPSESAFPIADALSNFPRCIQALEVSVHDLAANFWHEPLRKRAHELARAMSDGCKVCGFRESSGVLRSMESLLALPIEDTGGIQRSLTERLFELIGLLKDQARKARA